MKNHWWPFKVGDRVRVRRCAIVDHIGKPGTIVEADVSDVGVGYIVKFDDGKGCSFYDYHNRELCVGFLDEEKQQQYELKILMDKPVGDRFKHWTPKDYEIILAALRSMVLGKTSLQENLNEEQQQRAKMLLEEVDKYMNELKGIKSTT